MLALAQVKIVIFFQLYSRSNPSRDARCLARKQSNPIDDLAA